MHTPRPPKEAFRGHTIVHHGIYKGDKDYFLREGEHPEHILLKPYALPAIFLAHLPVALFVERFVLAHTAIGAMTACLLYFVVYEYMHWNMHVPRNQFVERFRWFQFLRNHHKLHHRYFQKNFCVLIPLADWCLGTLATEESLARRKAEREQAIVNGTLHTRSKPVRVHSRAAQNDAPKTAMKVEATKFRARHAQGRKTSRLGDLRAMLQLVASRRDR